MYEGKHIHFSEVDNKPLCSYSAKLCKQRRLNGYAFCIRHVLEDVSAPFKQCEFVAKYNRLRCTNPIPGEENRKFCNSHMQVLGLAPKRGKKRKGDQSPDSRNDSRNDSSNAGSKGGSQEREKHKKKSKDKKKKKKKKKKKEKHKKKGNRSILDDVMFNSKGNFELNNLNLLCRSRPPDYPGAVVGADNRTFHSNSVERAIKTKSKRRKDGSTLHERLQEKLERNKQRLRQQREKEMLAKSMQHTPFSNAATLEHTNNLLDSGVVQYKNSSYLDSQKYLPLMPPLVEGKGRVPSLPWPQIPQHLSSPREAFVKLQRKHPKDLFARKLDSPAVDLLRERLQQDEDERTDIFPLGLDFSDTDDEESEEVTDRRCRNTCKEQYSLSHISSTDDTNSPLSRQSRLKQLKSHLQRDRRKLELGIQCDKHTQKDIRRSSKLLVDAAREHPFGTAVSVLRVQEETLQRPKPQAPPERICCSKEENEDPCQEEAMPYSKHCFRHILEDEEQVLFYQCGAEFPGGFRCIEPSFDMLNEQPLCQEHAKRVRMEPKSKRPRKKTKPSALTRPFKKKKKSQRRKVRPQKPIPPLEPLQNYQLPISTPVMPVATPHPPPHTPAFRSPPLLGAHDLPVHLMDMSALEEVMNAEGVESPPEDLNSDAEEEALSSVLQNLNDIFEGRNGDFLPTREEAEALERAFFQASEDDAKLSLDQLFNDGEENSNSLPGDVSEANINQDSSDGLPSDLQSAANRLIADTMRQNSNDGSNHNAIKPPSSNLTNPVPLSNMPAAAPSGQAFTLPSTLSGMGVFTNSVAQFNGPVIPQTQSMLTQNALSTAATTEDNHQDSLRHTVLNGVISGNRAMVPSFPISQPIMSPHGGQQVPHPMMSPQSPQIITTTLPQASPNASSGMSPSASAPTPSQAAHQAALPSFRQTWSTVPNIQNALRRTNTNSVPTVNGINSNGGLPYGVHTSQPIGTQKLPSFNSVVAGITQNHIPQQPSGFAPGLPSPQPTSGIPTPPYTAPNIKNIPPIIKQQGT
ncbi:INO80 complex subunit D-like isoform X2 [Lytechinus variegatus]|nr:INO80 complex subunit D-like isoform X2 [Lytechinus variegatus]